MPVLERLGLWLLAVYWLLSAGFSVLQTVPVLPLLVIADYPPILLGWMALSLLTACVSLLILIPLLQRRRSAGYGLLLLLLLFLGYWVYSQAAGYSIQGWMLLNPLMALLSLCGLWWLSRRGWLR